MSKLKQIAAAFFALASPAVACDAMVFHVASYHTDRDMIPAPNETNPGIGCRLGGFEAGAYLNSYADTSLYAVYDWVGDHGFGLFAGAATGYDQDLHSLRRGVMPLAGAVYRGEVVTLRATPTLNTGTGALGAVFGLSVSLGG